MPSKREEDIRSSGNGVTETVNWSELPCGCWELNSGPLEEQLGLLTMDPSLQPQGNFLIIF